MKKREKNSDYYYLSNKKMIEAVFSSRVSLLAFYSSEKVLSAQVCSLACASITNGSLTEDKDKAGSAKVNKSGHVKKITVTTNNRIQAGFTEFSPAKEGEALDTKQLTNRMHKLIRKIQTSLECSKRFIPPQTDRMIHFYSILGCSESKVIFK